MGLVHTKDLRQDSSFECGDALADGGGELTKHFVCESDDMKDGEMRAFSGPNDVNAAIFKRNGKFYALNDRCSHFPVGKLSKGTFYGNRVMCPLHGACFDIATGDIEDAPALKSLHTYQLSLHYGKLYIELPSKEAPPRIPKFVPRDETREDIVVIVGAGIAGITCAETLREIGYTGRIIVFSTENCLPYDRTKVSKNPLQKFEFVVLRPSLEWYHARGIELVHAEVTEVLPHNKTVRTSCGGTVSYEKCLIACGTSSRLPRTTLKNILTLREAADMPKVSAACSVAQRVVCVGGGFIALEAASWLRMQRPEVSVTIVGRQLPLESMLGREVGQALAKLHESKGVEVIRFASVVEYIGTDKIERLKLSNGRVLDCDVVVMGIGVDCCAAKFLKDIPLTPEGLVPVDMHMQTQVPHLYAAGDCAWGFLQMIEQHESVKHWNVALQHGRIAAQNMMGRHVAYTTVPFFWTAQYGASLRVAGSRSPQHSVFMHGDINEQKFIAAYHLNGIVTAIASMGRDPAVAAFAMYCSRNPPPTLQQVQEVDFDFQKLLDNVSSLQ